MRVAVWILLLSTLACASSDCGAKILRADLAPEITQSLALRSRYGIPTPEGEIVIYVDSVSVHHLREEQSAIATRDSATHWHLTKVMEEGPGLLKVEPHLISDSTRVLSEAEGQKLDKLLQDADLYRESSPGPASPPDAGTFFHTMEIDSPAGHALFRWTGRLNGKAGAVADLLLGAD